MRISLKRGEFKIIKIPGLKMDGNLFIIYSQRNALSTAARDFLALLHQRRGKSERRNALRSTVASALFLYPVLESILELSSASDLLFYCS